jgi:thiol-disulfide isomerase/thioredoxin
MKLLITNLIFIFFNTLSAQTEVFPSIKCSLTGLKSNTITLGYYFGDQMFKADSTNIDTLFGSFQFPVKKLHPGQYFVSIKEGKLFDFWIDDNQRSFEIKGDMQRLDSLIAINSPENTVFFDFSRFAKKQDFLIEQANSSFELIRRASKNDRSLMAEFEQKIRDLNIEKSNYAIQLATANPTFRWSKTIKSVQIPIVPTSIPMRTADQKMNPAYFSWIKDHFWDNTNFQDSTLLYNDIWINYFEAYLGKLTPAHPDSLNQNMDLMLSKIPKNGFFYQYLVKHVTQKFELTDWPFADKVFVHMVDTYQNPKNTPWLDQVTLLRLEDKANAHRSNLVGNIAPDLLISDVNEQIIDLKKIESNLILLIFYSPLCHHCQEAMPIIYQSFLDFEAKGLKAIAVNTDKEYEYWKGFVKENNRKWLDVADPTGANSFEKPFSAWNLPVIYLLDKDKRILRKRIKPEQLNELLTTFYRR